jgi:hypothetical protein
MVLARGVTPPAGKNGAPARTLIPEADPPVSFLGKA